MCALPKWMLTIAVLIEAVLSSTALLLQFAAAQHSPAIALSCAHLWPRRPCTKQQPYKQISVRQGRCVAKQNHQCAKTTSQTTPCSLHTAANQSCHCRCCCDEKHVALGRCSWFRISPYGPVAPRNPAAPVAPGAPAAPAWAHMHRNCERSTLRQLLCCSAVQQCSRLGAVHCCCSRLGAVQYCCTRLGAAADASDWSQTHVLWYASSGDARWTSSSKCCACAEAAAAVCRVSVALLPALLLGPHNYTHLLALALCWQHLWLPANLVLLQGLLADRQAGKQAGRQDINVHRHYE